MRSRDALPTRPGRLARELAISGFGMVIVRILGAAGGVLVARLLGPELRGDLAVIVVVGTLLGSAATFGLQFWAIRTTAGHGPTSQVVRILRAHIRATTVVSLSVVAALGLAGVRPAWLALFALSAGWTSSSLRLAIPSGMRRVRVVALAQALGALTYATVVLALLIAGWESVPLTVLATASAQWVIGGVGALATRRIKVQASEPVGSSRYSAVLRETVPAALGDVLLIAAVRFDVVLVAMFLDQRDAGLYAVALSVAELPTLVGDATAQVALPFVSGDRSRRSIAVVHRCLLLTAGLLGVALLLLAPMVIPVVFGQEFEGSIAPLGPLLVGGLCLGSWKLLVVDLSARGRNGTRAATAAAGVSTMVVADVVLIPSLGLPGAAVGSMLGFAVAAGSAAWTWRHDQRGRFMDLYRVRPSDLGLLAQSVRGLQSRAAPVKDREARQRDQRAT